MSALRNYWRAAGPSKADTRNPNRAPAKQRAIDALKTMISERRTAQPKGER